MNNISLEICSKIELKNFTLLRIILRHWILIKILSTFFCSEMYNIQPTKTTNDSSLKNKNRTNNSHIKFYGMFWVKKKLLDLANPE